MELADLDVHLLRVVVDDEGIPLADVAYTGSTGMSAPAAPVQPPVMAIEGHEDR
jgi:hypothetical protein